MIYTLLGVGEQVDTPVGDLEDAKMFLFRGVKWHEPKVDLKNLDDHRTCRSLWCPEGVLNRHLLV